MFFIDLNHCYFKVTNAGQVWVHNLDELQWLIPDDELVHVRRGKEVAVMPLATIHQWLYPFGPFDARTDSYPREYAENAQNIQCFGQNVFGELRAKASYPAKHRPTLR